MASGSMVPWRRIGPLGKRRHQHGPLRRGAWQSRPAPRL